MTQTINQYKKMLRDSKWGITLYGMFCRYKENTEDNPELQEAGVDYSTYSAVLREFNSMLVDALISDALEFKIPYGFGKLRIKKFKQHIKLDKDGNVDKKNMPVDWKKTWDLWFDTYPGLTRAEIKKVPDKKRIYHLNEHTAGYRCVLFWDRINCNVRNNRVYSAAFTFTNRRKLSHMLQTDCKINYYE